MQLKSKRHFIVTFFIAGISTLLFSFSSSIGGDMFEIYVNNKLVLQQHVAEAKTAQNLSFDQGNPNDEIYIRYSHCGVTGKKRNITIKNSQNRTLRSWQFADLPDKNMICKMKDFVELQKLDGILYIYYSSQELPNGKLLATIN